MSTSITILHGNLGKDPEIFRTDSDFPIATFSLATARRISDGNNGKKDITDWHNIKALGKNAELAEKYLHKGKEIIVTGHNETRDYDDKDGKKCYMTEVVVDRIDFCGSASDSNQSGGGYQQQGTGRQQQGTGRQQQGTGRQQQGTGRQQQGTGRQQQGTGRQQQSTGRQQQSGYNQNQGGGYQQQHGDEVPYDAPR